jgi:hypothetical protein
MHHSPILTLVLALALAFAFAATALAAPSICPTTLYTNPQCCTTDVLGVLGQDCSARTSCLASRKRRG